jgi:hypothetical protein
LQAPIRPIDDFSSVHNDSLTSDRHSRARRAATVARLARSLFYKPAGLTGTIVRIALLMIGAVLSYFVGSGLGELMMKAPLPMALLFGAVFFALASKDTDQR